MEERKIEKKKKTTTKKSGRKGTNFCRLDGGSCPDSGSVEVSFFSSLLSESVLMRSSLRLLFLLSCCCWLIENENEKEKEVCLRIKKDQEVRESVVKKMFR
jgi:hypothetical protein